MNHKWDKDDECINCGIARTNLPYKKVIRTYSRLINGVWEDVPVYYHGIGWCYGQPHPEDKRTIKIIGFERPDCITHNTPSKT